MVKIICFIVLTNSFEVKAYKPICSINESRDAEIKVATIKTWEHLYQLFKNYSHCDDGGVAEGFSESVTSLLSVRWKENLNIVNIIKSDQEFRDFIIRHVDETVPIERLKLIDSILISCPEGLNDFCLKIEKAATR